VVRALLLEGARSTYLRAAAGGEAGPAATLSDEALWWPPLKVAAPRLAMYLTTKGATS
jgi:hypothetical protein